MYMKAVACTWSCLPVLGGGGLYLLTVAFTWRRWPVCGGGNLYLEEVACTCSPWVLRGGRGLYVKGVVCMWRRGSVLAHRGFYVEAVACTQGWIFLRDLWDYLIDNPDKFRQSLPQNMVWSAKHLLFCLDRLCTIVLRNNHELLKNN